MLFTDVISTSFLLNNVNLGDTFSTIQKTMVSRETNVVAGLYKKNCFLKNMLNCLSSMQCYFFQKSRYCSAFFFQKKKDEEEKIN